MINSRGKYILSNGNVAKIMANKANDHSVHFIKYANLFVDQAIRPTIAECNIIKQLQISA